jgi:hypothetical protein
MPVAGNVHRPSLGVGVGDVTIERGYDAVSLRYRERAAGAEVVLYVYEEKGRLRFRHRPMIAYLDISRGAE